MAKMQNWKQSAALGTHTALLLLGISGDIWTPRPRYERASFSQRPFSPGKLVQFAFP